jgi:hypothetical protein
MMEMASPAGNFFNVILPILILKWKPSSGFGLSRDREEIPDLSCFNKPKVAGG